MRVFRDRRDAGAQVARALQRFADAPDAIVLAHTRASVPVAYEVATRLALPLDVVRGIDVEIRGKTVLLVDDGDRARDMPGVIEGLRLAGAASVVAAVAVASPQVTAALHAGADHVVSVLSPQHIYSVQAWYADFSPPLAEEIRELLVAASQMLPRARRRNFLSRDVDT